MFFKAEETMELPKPYITQDIMTEGSAERTVARVSDVVPLRRHKIKPPLDNLECQRLLRFIKRGRGVPQWRLAVGTSPKQRVEHLIRMQDDFIGKRVEHSGNTGWSLFLFFEAALDRYLEFAKSPAKNPSWDKEHKKLKASVEHSLRAAILWDDGTFTSLQLHAITLVKQNGKTICLPQ
jgi:hypothetical protein